MKFRTLNTIDIIKNRLNKPRPKKFQNLKLAAAQFFKTYIDKFSSK